MKFARTEAEKSDSVEGLQKFIYNRNLMEIMKTHARIPLTKKKRRRKSKVVHNSVLQ